MPQWETPWGRMKRLDLIPSTMGNRRRASSSKVTVSEYTRFTCLCGHLLHSASAAEGDAGRNTMNLQTTDHGLLGTGPTGEQIIRPSAK